MGAQLEITDSDFVAGVRQQRYENWVLEREAAYQAEDPQGTPAAWLEGHRIPPGDLFDRTAFENRLRGKPRD